MSTRPSKGTILCGIWVSFEGVGDHGITGWTGERAYGPGPVRRRGVKRRYGDDGGS